MSDFMVKIHNENVHEYREKWRGSEIYIKAGGYHKMDYEQANMFLGQMQPFAKRKDGTQDPRTFKKLVMDKDDKRRVELLLRNESEEKAKRVFVCMACNKEFDSKAALTKHSKSEHSEIMVKDPDSEE